MIEQIASQMITECWLVGDLQYKLKPHQEVLYSNVVNSQGLKYIINCCRRFGKSFVLSLLAIEFALSHNGAHIRFAAPSQKQLTEIIQPIFGVISKDAPPDISLSGIPSTRIITFLKQMLISMLLVVTKAEWKTCEVIYLI